MEKFLTCEEVAEKYRVKAITVREWIKSGKLPALKMSGAAGYRIKLADLADFEKQCSTTTHREGQ